MSLPDLLAETVGDESVAAEVSLGGDDRLAVTPTRTLVYRGDGLLSDESVTEYSHDVERISVSTGRRKAKLTLGYGLDGDETISLPASRADEVLHPVLAGVLSATGVTDPGESVLRTFRFSELTLVVTSDRLVKHVGSAVWDEEFEEFSYADLADLDFEEGTVATAVVLAHGGRSERFKAPNESARALRETLVDAVCAYHDVDSLEEFRVTVAADDEGDADTDGTTDFGEGPDPLSASPVADAEADAEGRDGVADEGDTPLSADDAGGADPTDEADPLGAAEPARPAADADGAVAGRSSGSDPLTERPVDDSAVGVDSPPATDVASDTAGEPGGPTGRAASAGVGEPAARDEAAAQTDDDAFDGSPFESAGVEGEDLATEVAELRHTVEQQSERLDRQSTLIEQLIEELRRGR
ncbi:MAG: hypothetical protein R6U01_02970 [Halorubrum sp.]|uniref:DUF7115 domain-containing protein n=1 Tax=Halorubrum sp. TaxID=1879286 RepID=UPI003970C90B